MTTAQESFARAVAAGASLSDAFRAVNPKSLNWKPTALHKRASELAHRPEVAAKIDELRNRADTETVMEIAEARAMLTQRAREIYEGNGKTLDLCRVLAQLAAISGWSAGATAGAKLDAQAADEQRRADERREEAERMGMGFMTM